MFRLWLAVLKQTLSDSVIHHSWLKLFFNLTRLYSLCIASHSTFKSTFTSLQVKFFLFLKNFSDCYNTILRRMNDLILHLDQKESSFPIYTKYFLMFFSLSLRKIHIILLRFWMDIFVPLGLLFWFSSTANTNTFYCNPTQANGSHSGSLMKLKLNKNDFSLRFTHPSLFSTITLNYF